MTRPNHKDVAFFIGVDVQNTPFFSNKTLFVVGQQPLEKIKEHAVTNQINTIYLGANHSFTVETIGYYDNVISDLIDNDYLVTLEYPVVYHEKMLANLSPQVWKSSNFIPLVSTCIPKLHSTPNLILKIDDVDFRSTNPGVWCLNYKTITNYKNFTKWDDYQYDEILETIPTKESPEFKLDSRMLFVTFQQEGYHYYTTAPKEVDFLKYKHRHLFHFRVSIEVFHDRDIESILFKQKLVRLYNDEVLYINHKSCDMLAEDLLRYLSMNYPNRDIVVEVSEDNENGVILTYRK